jgi:hypothetical protein
MARVMVGTWFGDKKIFYNIGQAVGRGAANVRDDVAVVQMLIKNANKYGGLSMYGLAEPPPMKVDGLYGPITQKWIDYVSDAAPGLLSKPDGRVDPMPPSGITKTGNFTILYLLNQRINFYPFRFDIGEDPECPQYLRAEVSLGRVGYGG